MTGPLRSEADVVHLARRGVPAAAVDHLLEHMHLTFAWVDQHIVPRRTFVRRRQAGQPLDAGASDRLLRLTRLVASAEETFGDPDKARSWLERENRALEGQTPLSLADTDAGARRVETLLGRIAHGIAA